MPCRRFARAAASALVALALPACGAGGLGEVADEVESLVRGAHEPPTGATMSAKELVYAQQVLALVNQERASRGIAPVVWDGFASDAAYDHAVDMDRRNFFEHDNPDGLDPGERLRYAGVTTGAWGENIAMGEGSPTSVMHAWMNSPGHRTNLLNPAWQRLGVGVHMGLDGPWWVEDFVH